MEKQKLAVHSKVQSRTPSDSKLSTFLARNDLQRSVRAISQASPRTIDATYDRELMQDNWDGSLEPVTLDQLFITERAEGVLRNVRMLH